MTAFKVLIVGGSVAGLTLANILERYGIDYVLLEKHKMLAPQLGASLALWPFGLRILEQLGMYEKLSSMGRPLNRLKTFDPEGLLLNDRYYMGDLFEELFGYRMIFLDRQQLLQTLFDNLKDKSKIHTSCEVFKLENLDGMVELSTVDGTIFRGDIVVGADGVHSRVRQELWRIADGEDPSYRSDKLSKSITCTYRCIFGISKRPDDIADDRGFKTYRKNRSYLYQSGADGKLYWFAFVKNSQKTTHKSIPRYDAQDVEKLVGDCADDILFPGFTFRDLYARRMYATLVPLEEYILDRNFFKRGILIGDAFHKVNPLTGYGGNSAIESAAILADMLKEALDKSPQLDEPTLQFIFAKFQKQRQLRMKPIMDGTKLTQRLEILDNFFLKFVNLKLITRAGPAFMATAFAEPTIPGYFLRYLPLENDKGMLALSIQVKANPRKRPTVATAFWIFMMLSISILIPHYPGWAQNVTSTKWASPLQEKAGSTFPTVEYKGQNVLQAYVSTFAIIINSLWVVESYRPRFALCSAIPFTIASMVFGWDVVLPIYFSIHIFLSQSRKFYYPAPRAIDAFVAMALPAGLMIAYILPTMQTLANMTTGSTMRLQALNRLPLMIAHIGMPIVLRIMSSLFKRKAPPISTPQLVYGSQDMMHLSRFFTILFIFASSMHLIFASYFFTRFTVGVFLNAMASSMEWRQLISMGMTVIIWCIFVVWDLQRVDVMRTSFSMGLIMIIGGSVVFGPAAVLAALWKWRESLMEESRKRK